MNVYKTYVCSLQFLFPGGCEGASKLANERILLSNNLLKVNNKYTKIRCENSPSLK